MNKKTKQEYSFTDKEMSFLDGLLLGDGFIEKKGGKLGLNTSSLQFAEFVMNLFPKYIWTDSGIMTNKVYDKRIDKTLTIYRLISHNNVFFEKQRKRWYTEEGKKIVPTDVRINKDSVLLWYLGDGTLCQHYKRKETNEIKLCTNSFTYDEIDTVLLPPLLDFMPHIRMVNEHAPVIMIPRKRIMQFLEYIGKPPFKDYEHKWNVFPYKNKNIEKNGISYLEPEMKEKIVKDYINGEKTRSISKKYNLDQTHVIYFCKKAGVYDKARDKQEYEIYKDGEIIGKTKNLKYFCSENKLCYTNLISLCSGKLKKYKNYSIKKV